MASNYRLEKNDDSQEWDRFITSTEYGTIFQYSIYLNALQIRHSRYLIYNNNELRAAIVLVESEDGIETMLDDYVIYNGIVFGSATTGQNNAQRLSEQFRVAEFVAETLPSIYKKVEFSLSPQCLDVRPFLWFNYGADLSKYQVDIRYTSFVDISDFADTKHLDDIVLYQKSSKARRQVIRYARRDEVVTSEEFDADAFMDLYTSTMKRQDLDVARSMLDKMRNLITVLYKNELLKMFVSRTKDEKIGSMACFATDHVRAYYLFGANEPELRDYHTGTAVLWESFYKLAAAGINEVDLEGVNSPKRGWFKLSFGGNLVPYYEMSII